jgi:hypothetical protein
LTDGEDGFALAQPQGLDTFHARIDWLDETGLLERNAVWNTDRAVVDDPIHDSDVFGETAAGSLESGGASDLLVGCALGKSLVLAVKTLAAGNVVEDHDPVAGTVILHAFADGSDRAGSFVSENARGRVGTRGNLLQVGAAYAAGVDADQHFSSAYFGDGDRFHADVIHAAVDGG